MQKSFGQISSRREQLQDTILRKIILGGKGDDDKRVERALTHLNANQVRGTPAYAPLRKMTEYQLGLRPCSPHPTYYVSPPREKK